MYASGIIINKMKTFAAAILSSLALADIEIDNGNWMNKEWSINNYDETVDANGTISATMI